LEYRPQVKGRAADDLEHIGGGHLLPARLFKLTTIAVELFLEVGNGYRRGPRFASFGSNRAPILDRPYVSTVAQHIALGWFTAMLNFTEVMTECLTSRP
jgi:hypothetical protein